MRAILAVIVVSAGCLKAPVFHCATSDECGPGGTCAAGYCAFFDPMCADGERYGERSGPYSGQCVGATTSDANPGGPFTPSNGVDPTLAGEVAVPIAISGTATFDTDTGAITGAVVRAAGQGVVADVGYHQVGTLGVFVLHALDVQSAGALRFQGSRAVVLLVGTDATIDGTIDGSAGCYGADPTCAGPGGGTGASGATAATGCGAGGAGGTDPSENDGGGGGGGGGTPGASGGAAGAGVVGGAGGGACLAADLQPLVGGGGGGAGGPGSSTSPAQGGGGGGGLQLTALGAITVGGTITMAGAGGPGGPTASVNAGAGGGGGGGGGILLEANSVTVTGTLAANGGGGGSGGHAPDVGNPGENGHADASPARGGASVGSNGVGGNGAARSASAQDGQTIVGNAGGGGGGVGVVHVRAHQAPSLTGTVSPAATTAIF